jgi:hypothetical protein
VIIGLAGKKQSGKDTVADYLVEQYGYIKLGFADAVKHMALVIDPVLPVAHAKFGGYIYLTMLVTELGWEEAKKIPAVRKFLQTLGTEAGRNILGEDVWVNALLKYVEEYDLRDVVIKDVRYSNEARVCNFTVHIVRDGTDDGDTHSSEIIDFESNAVINNNSTLADLYKEVDRLMGIIEHATE